MGWESFDVVRLDLGPLLQGQMRVVKLKSVFKLLIIEKCCLSSKLCLFRWIYLASGHRCVLGLVLYVLFYCITICLPIETECCTVDYQKLLSGGLTHLEAGDEYADGCEFVCAARMILHSSGSHLV